MTKKCIKCGNVIFITNRHPKRRKCSISCKNRIPRKSGKKYVTIERERRQKVIDDRKRIFEEYGILLPAIHVQEI